MKTVIDRENFTVYVVTPSGAEIEVAKTSDFLSGEGAGEWVSFIHSRERLHFHKTYSKAEAFSALLMHLGLTETEQSPVAPKESEEIQQLKKELNVLTKITHDMTVANQAAWIEWQHGCGAEAAMQWVENGLCGPGFIPDEDEPYGKEAQAYYDANKYEPFPFCYCGRPSNILSGSEGFCCEEHLDSRRAQTETQENSNV